MTQSTVRCFWPVRAGTHVFYSFFDQSVSPRHCMVIVLFFYQMFLRMMMKKPNSSPITTAFITFLIRYSRFLLGILRHQFQTRQQKCLLVNCILVLTLFHCRNAFRVGNEEQCYGAGPFLTGSGYFFHWHQLCLRLL